MASTFLHVLIRPSARHVDLHHLGVFWNVSVQDDPTMRKKSAKPRWKSVQQKIKWDHGIGIVQYHLYTPESPETMEIQSKSLALFTNGLKCSHWNQKCSASSHAAYSFLAGDPKSLYCCRNILYIYIVRYSMNMTTAPSPRTHQAHSGFIVPRS